MKIAGVTILSQEEVPNDYGRWLIHGPQGAGKTTLASTVARMGKTLFIDLNGEKGVRAFRGAPYAKNIDVVRPESVTALDDIFWELNKGDHDYKAVVIDSLTAVQKKTLRYLMKHDETAVREITQGVAPADQRTWGQSLDVMVDIATFWYGLADGDRENPIHVVMTAQTKVLMNELTGDTERTPDVQKGALSITLATPDYILYADAEEDMEDIDDEGNPSVRHIVRFGKHPGYSTKARVPYNLRGKLPRIVGRGKNSPDLLTLSRVLGIGGIPKTASASSSKKAEESA